jgi:predicted nicotinamide N-methyase
MNLERPVARLNFPSTPLEALGPTAREKVIIEGRTFVVAHPEESDQLMHHPAVRTAYASHQYLPYWTELWPASRMLAKVILREPWAPGLEALEVGCGLGLPGLAALAAGLRVIFSDVDTAAMHFADLNARANGFDRFRLLQLDWNDPPADLRVPVVLASDLFFESRNIEPLVGLIRKVLEPGGVCLLSDENRAPPDVLQGELTRAGLSFSPSVIRAGEPGKRRSKGTLYRITHAADKP